MCPARLRLSKGRARPPPPSPSPCTNWTRLVLPPVLSGHAADGARRALPQRERRLRPLERAPWAPRPEAARGAQRRAGWPPRACPSAPPRRESSGPPRCCAWRGVNGPASLLLLCCCQARAGAPKPNTPRAQRAPFERAEAEARAAALRHARPRQPPPRPAWQVRPRGPSPPMLPALNTRCGYGGRDAACPISTG